MWSLTIRCHLVCFQVCPASVAFPFLPLPPLFSCHTSKAAPLLGFLAERRWQCALSCVRNPPVHKKTNPVAPLVCNRCCCVVLDTIHSVVPCMETYGQLDFGFNCAKIQATGVLVLPILALPRSPPFWNWKLCPSLYTVNDKNWKKTIKKKLNRDWIKQSLQQLRWAKPRRPLKINVKTLKITGVWSSARWTQWALTASFFTFRQEK